MGLLNLKAKEDTVEINVLKATTDIEVLGARVQEWTKQKKEVREPSSMKSTLSVLTTKVSDVNEKLDKRLDELKSMLQVTIGGGGGGGGEVCSCEYHPSLGDG